MMKIKMVRKLIIIKTGVLTMYDYLETPFRTMLRKVRGHRIRRTIQKD